ncbi:hypothetical protein IJT93_07115 [bacterium]|nr:hypothetical protein [bacterium]
MGEFCPLLQKPCVREECAWYAAGLNRCAVVAIGMITEKIHDMGVQAHQVYVGPNLPDMQAAEAEETVQEEE